MTQRLTQPFFESAPEREQYFFALYRALEASLIAALLFSPLSNLIGEPRLPMLATGTALAYLLIATGILLAGRVARWRGMLIVFGVLIDIVVATLISHAVPSMSNGISLMLAFNVAAAALLLPLSSGLSVALLAALALLGEHAWTRFLDPASSSSLGQTVMLAASYVVLAWLANALGEQARKHQRLAESRGSALAEQVELNELIIRRMRTGVLLVDEDGRIRLANEAALAALGSSDGPLDGRLLREVAHPLSQRLAEWRRGGERLDQPLQVTPDQPAVLPLFAGAHADSGMTLVFLDDASLVSRRAETLTLSTLGRFSASLAHEVRNPLASISYAAELLGESNLAVDDRRLVEIIVQQCRRTNAIIETVMGMARREQAAPEQIELRHFVDQFVKEFLASHPPDADIIEAAPATRPAVGAFDPRHLHQILTTLVHNALNHGRLPGQPARVSLVVYTDERATIDVIDRGPGIPPGIADQLFKPFFTTAEHGTGLGLYMARELCTANQSELRHVPIPGGGSCFRLRMPLARRPLES